MPIPQLDPMPVPGPLWLIRTLLLLTFSLHLLFMNTLLGGTAVALVANARRARSAQAARLAADLAHILPAVFAFTITLGVAPLLFLQVLYGHLLYASSILMAIPWLSIIGLVLCAYYAVYFFSLRRERAPRAAGMVLGGAVVLLAAVGFIYTNNFTLMLAPGNWLDIYARSERGWNLNLAEPTLLPRYLHFVLAAFAVTGMFLLVLGVRRRAEAYGHWLIEQGSMLFTGATVANFAVGIWFFVAIPRAVRTAWTGGNGWVMAGLVLGALLPVAAIAHLMLLRAGKPQVRNVTVAIACGVLTVGMMALLRDALRNAYLAPNFRLDQLQVAPQWGVIGLFVVVFIAGLATLGWMLLAVSRAAKAPVAVPAASGQK
jgi:hypothetical protein